MIGGMKKNYALLKREAIKLRKEGLSYNEIRKQIPVAKSSLSLWLKSIPLSEADRKRLYNKQIQILLRGPYSQKERREKEVKAIIEKAEKEIKLPLSFDTYRLLGAFLYWAEGSKGKMFNMANSDPYLILFFVRWIEKIFGIKAKNLKARLNIYPQQNELKIKKFWFDLTGIPIKNFGKSFVKPLSSGFKKNNLYYGTIRIEVPKSVDMRYRVYAWTRAVLKDIGPNIKLVEKRWQSLKETPRPVNL